MSVLDPSHDRGNYVFLSKPRVLVNPDESAIIEVDVVQTTLVFRRNLDAPIIFCGAFVDVWHDDRVSRVPYLYEVHGALVSRAQDRALDACAQFDGEPVTEPRGAT